MLPSRGSGSPSHAAGLDVPVIESLRSAFPPARWLREYKPAWLAADAISGVTLAAYAIPVAMAYATLAGLPPQHGIYGYLLGGLAYALLGSSRQLAIGPTSAMSMLVGATLLDMADGDPTRWAVISALTAAVLALMCLRSEEHTSELQSR